MLNVFVLMSLMATLSHAPIENQNIRMDAMYITSLDYSADIVYCVNSTGFEYAFYGCEDYLVDDLVCVLLSDNGTPYISDDIILDTCYSGFWIEENDEICGGVGLGWMHQSKPNLDRAL